VLKALRRVHREKAIHAVLASGMQFVAQPPVFAHLTFGQLRFGVLDGLGLGEDALPLVALPRPAPPHDDRTAGSASLLGG